MTKSNRIDLDQNRKHRELMRQLEQPAVIMPSRLANAVAGVYVFMRPEPLIHSALCPVCHGMRRMTKCAPCNSSGRVLMI